MTIKKNTAAYICSLGLAGIIYASSAKAEHNFTTDHMNSGDQLYLSKIDDIGLNYTGTIESVLHMYTALRIQDGKGIPTVEEFLSDCFDVVDEKDKDGDGVNEWKRYRLKPDAFKPNKQTWDAFEKADTDHNREISPGEAIKYSGIE